MGFDIVSMKLRAKDLMGEANSSILLARTVYGVFIFIYFVAVYLLIGMEGNLLILLLILGVVEVIYLNIRASCDWYSLLLSREEDTKNTDVFIAFHENSLKVFVVGILKDVCMLIGICCCGIGVLMPIYWFRFSIYIVKDENVGVFTALSKSMRLLKGHYKELVSLDVSNIGWYILMLFTWGIAGFYVKPYLTVLYAEFYDYLKGCAEILNE